MYNHKTIGVQNGLKTQTISASETLLEGHRIIPYHRIEHG